MVWGGRYRGHMAELMTRFIEAYGSPNHLGNSARGSEGILKGHFFTMGIRDFLAIHWEEGHLAGNHLDSVTDADRFDDVLLRTDGLRILEKGSSRGDGSQGDRPPVVLALSV